MQFSKQEEEERQLKKEKKTKKEDFDLLEIQDCINFLLLIQIKTLFLGEILSNNQGTLGSFPNEE